MNRSKTFMAAVFLSVFMLSANLVGQTPLAHYTFDDGTANDISGNGNHGTLAGTATIVNDAVRGMVLSLDGAGGKVDIGSPASLEITGEVTLAAWVNITAIGGNRNIVNRGHGGTPTREFTLRTDGTNYDMGQWQSASTGGNGDENATIPVPAEDVGQNTWVHLAGTCTNEGGQFFWRFYRNGVLEATSVGWVDGLRPMTGVGWAIGARGGVAGFERLHNGLIDDVRIYNAALTEAQIQAIVNPTPPVNVAMVVNTPTTETMATRGFDLAIYDLLTSRGMNVTLVDDAAVNTSGTNQVWVEAFDLLVISESCSSGQVANLRNLSVPTLANEYIAWDQQNYATLGAGVDGVWQDNQTAITISGLSHPILNDAGVSAGNVTIYAQPTRLPSRDKAQMASGIKQLGDVVVGTPPTTHVSFWAIDIGEALADGTPAAARSASFPLSGESSSTVAMGGGPRTLADLTPQGLALFEATIDWLLEEPGAPNAIPANTWTLY